MYQVNFRNGLGLTPITVDSKQVAQYRKSSLVVSIWNVTDLHNNPKEIWGTV